MMNEVSKKIKSIIEGNKKLSVSVSDADKKMLANINEGLGLSLKLIEESLASNDEYDVVLVFLDKNGMFLSTEMKVMSLIPGPGDKYRLRSGKEFLCKHSTVSKESRIVVAEMHELTSSQKVSVSLYSKGRSTFHGSAEVKEPGVLSVPGLGKVVH